MVRKIIAEKIYARRVEVANGTAAQLRVGELLVFLGDDRSEKLASKFTRQIGWQPEDRLSIKQTRNYLTIGKFGEDGRLKFLRGVTLKIPPDPYSRMWEISREEYERRRTIR